jgi:transposase
VQILHPFAGSAHAYAAAVLPPDRYRPDRCPQCQALRALVGHGWYRRTLVDIEFDGTIRVRRYLCRSCRRTTSLLPAFALPYVRFSLAVITRFLTARLLEGTTLSQAAAQAAPPGMPYQRGQGWVRRFHRQAVIVAAALVTLTAPPAASSVVARALRMLQAVGWERAHRFLFAELRVHLLGWPSRLVPTGQAVTLQPGGGCG